MIIQITASHFEMSLAHYLDISSIVHQWNQELIGLWETSKEITKQHNSQKCTCGFACTCMWRPEVSPGCWPSGAARLAFWNWSLTRTWDLPVRQGCLWPAPGICLHPLPQHWDYQLLPQCLAFDVVPGIRPGFSCLRSRHFTSLSYPHPVPSFSFNWN